MTDVIEIYKIEKWMLMLGLLEHWTKKSISGEYVICMLMIFGMPHEDTA